MMKKLCIIVVYILIIVNAFAEKIGVLSFNINGSFTSNRSANPKWCSQISSIISENSPDIVLLQEFPIKKEDKRLLEKILSDLGANNWSYFCTDKYFSGKHSNQNSIVFYNLNTILPCPEGDELINFSEEKPLYTFVKNNYQVIHFCLSTDQAKDFILINIHTPFDDKSDFVKYYADMKQLKEMYDYLKASYKPVILAGDFNTNREDLLSKYFIDEYIDGKWGRYFFIAGNQTRGLLTTLKRKSEKRGISLASDYDHFVISGIEVSKEMKHSFYHGNDYGNDYYGRIKLGNKYYTSNQEIMKEVSDHLPVFIELDF